MSFAQRLRGRAIAAYLGEGAVRWRRKLHHTLGSPDLELYFQIDDPYSYLLAQVLEPITRAAGLRLELLLVPPPSPDVDTEPELRLAYAMRDAALLRDHYEVAFPERAVAPTAERVRRANAILAVDRPGDAQLDLAQRVGAAVWAAEDDQLAGLARTHGTADAGVSLARNDRLRRRRGHYGGGMLRYAGEWYWGIDRLHHLRRHLREEGREVPELPILRDREDAPLDGELEMFFSFRSPYSYVAAVRAIEMCDAHGVDLRIRPVLPMVMRGHTVPLVKRLYIVRDTAREARRFGVPFGNLCDPLGPGIERCLAVFYRARHLGREREVVASIGRGIWSEARDVSRDAELRALVERAGMEWREARDALRGATPKEETERNREALYALGLWGVPSFHIGDLSVWGNDRLNLVEKRLPR